MADDDNLARPLLWEWLLGLEGQKANGKHQVPANAGNQVSELSSGCFAWLPAAANSYT
jgi:hypothetical protein